MQGSMQHSMLSLGIHHLCSQEIVICIAMKARVPLLHSSLVYNDTATHSTYAMMQYIREAAAKVQRGGPASKGQKKDEPAACNCEPQQLLDDALFRHLIFAGHPVLIKINCGASYSCLKQYHCLALRRDIAADNLACISIGRDRMEHHMYVALVHLTVKCAIVRITFLKW